MPSFIKSPPVCCSNLGNLTFLRAVTASLTRSALKKSFFWIMVGGAACHGGQSWSCWSQFPQSGKQNREESQRSASTLPIECRAPAHGVCHSHLWAAFFLSSWDNLKTYPEVCLHSDSTSYQLGSQLDHSGVFTFLINARLACMSCIQFFSQVYALQTFCFFWSVPCVFIFLMLFSCLEAPGLNKDQVIKLFYKLFFLFFSGKYFVNLELQRWSTFLIVMLF